ncbi:hypothetical protein SESBI_04420 [Sesbania bispinosa]|nr:hypothetical protein SESBI_04420 [Sesbania bispinosa]
MQPNQHKDVLLKPRAPISSNQISALLPANVDFNNANNDDNSGTSFYMCPNRCNYNVTCDNTTPCPGGQFCGLMMTSKVQYVGKKVTDQENISINNGFVKEIATFMVMDDLVVEPMSTISSITLLNKFNVKEIGTLQEKGIKLLKASLQTKMVLTSVFLKNNVDM